MLGVIIVAVKAILLASRLYRRCRKGTIMSYETKVILALLAQRIGMAKSVKEAYEAIVMAASVEGLKLPSYEGFLKNIGQEE